MFGLNLLPGAVTAGRVGWNDNITSYGQWPFVENNPATQAGITRHTTITMPKWRWGFYVWSGGFCFYRVSRRLRRLAILLGQAFGLNLLPSAVTPGEVGCNDHITSYHNAPMVTQLSFVKKNPATQAGTTARHTTITAPRW